MNGKEKTLNDFNIIKEAISRSKKNSQWVKKSFLILGVMNTALLFLQLMVNLFVSSHSVIATISSLLSIGIYIVTAVLFVRISNKEKRHTNIFFRLFILMFLLSFVILPIVFLVVRGLMAISNIGNNESLIVFQQMIEFLNIFIFSISLLIVSFINEKALFFGLSIINIFAYLLLFVINNSISINQVQTVSVQYNNLYSVLVSSIGYILLYYLIKDTNQR